MKKEDKKVPDAPKRLSDGSLSKPIQESTITHIDWIGVEEEVGIYLEEHQVCLLLGISQEELDVYLRQGSLKKDFIPIKGELSFNIIDVKYFAEKYLDIKDGSYIHDNDEAKDKEEFFTTICSNITRRVKEAKNGTIEKWRRIWTILSNRSLRDNENSIIKYNQDDQEGGTR